MHGASIKIVHVDPGKTNPSVYLLSGNATLRDEDDFSLLDGVWDIAFDGNTILVTEPLNKRIRQIGNLSLTFGPCAMGFVQNDEVDGLCVPCGHGFFCPDGVSRQTCPQNMTTLTDTASSSESCQCASGLYLSENTCLACEENFYCNNNTQYQCPENTASLPGAKSIQDCKCDDTTSYIDQNSCKLCEANFYCTDLQKFACPSNAISFPKASSEEMCFCDNGFKKNENSECQSCQSANELCQQSSQIELQFFTSFSVSVENLCDKIDVLILPTLCQDMLLKKEFNDIFFDKVTTVVISSDDNVQCTQQQNRRRALLQNNKNSVWEFTLSYIVYNLNPKTLTSIQEKTESFLEENIPKMFALAEYFHSNPDQAEIFEKGHPAKMLLMHIFSSNLMFVRPGQNEIFNVDLIELPSTLSLNEDTIFK